MGNLFRKSKKNILHSEGQNDFYNDEFIQYAIDREDAWNKHIAGEKLKSINLANVICKYNKHTNRNLYLER